MAAFDCSTPCDHVNVSSIISHVKFQINNGIYESIFDDINLHFHFVNHSESLKLYTLSYFQMVCDTLYKTIYLLV